MKTTKQILLVALMFVALITNAENKDLTNPINKKRVNVEFKSIKEKQTLTVENENGLSIYKRGVDKSNNNSKILFNINSLKNILSKTNVDNALLDDDKNKIFKPVIRTEENLVLISKIAFNKAPLYISLYYKGDLIHSETLKGNSIVNRIYKLSETEKGDYKVVINTDNKVYNKNFTI
ncbi:hypothetical protein [Polaribacter sargassicola]|uniref:hypothetical protein n=1 Tax=Polaribacter sargassicola TaxID=2836891 RepID=UPI001F43A111|nr:hypothetical protein [Polaribacter sp. DS7-9]MCG1034899.1 hypothetical protein [Polaribacter sp. DS7-9]